MDCSSRILPVNAGVRRSGKIIRNELPPGLFRTDCRKHDRTGSLVWSDWRSNRIVTLPDYQGIGIGKHFVAEKYKTAGCRVSIGTSHPAIVQSLRRDERWILTSIDSSGNNKDSMQGTKGLRNSIIIGRKVACFEYKGCVRQE